jgi:hypothetical protein
MCEHAPHTNYTHVQAETSSESVKLLGLRTLGEVGKDVDISGVAAVLPTIYGAFGLKSDATKNAASFALGNVTAGNLGSLFPQLVAAIKSKKARCRSHRTLGFVHFAEAVRFCLGKKLRAPPYRSRS